MAHKSRYQNKIDYLYYGSSKGTDFFGNEQDMFKRWGECGVWDVRVGVSVGGKEFYFHKVSFPTF